MVSRTVSLLITILVCLAALSAPGQPAADSPPNQEQLLAVLRGDAPLQEKWDAARLLARTATPAAVPALAAMLADDKTTEFARCALQDMPDAAAVDALRAALTTLKGKARVGAITSLGVRRDTQAVAPLTKLLADPDVETVIAAAAALGAIATAPAAEALDTFGVRASARLIPAAARSAIDSALLRCAEAAVAEGRREQAQAICDRLRDPQKPDGIRMEAIRGAILARGEPGAKLLLELIAGDDLIARSVALRVATHELPGAAATRALAEGLASLPADRKPALIQVLGNRGDGAAMPMLLAAAQKGENPARVAAIRSLARFATPETVPVLAAAAADANDELAAAAQQALASLPCPEADGAIRAMLEGSQTRDRLAGIRMAQDRRMASALPILLKAAQAGEGPVRLAALKASGELAGEANIPALLDLLANTSNPQERAAAEQAIAAAIGRGTHPEASVDQCVARLANAPAPLKCSLLRVLSLAGGAKALASVRAAANDPSEEIRTAALRSLFEWKNAEAAPVLLQLATSAASERDRLLCLRGLIRFANDPALPVARRLELCKQVAPLIQRDDEKILLLGALGGIAHPQALGLIAPHLDEPALREEAGAAVLRVAEQLLKGRNAAAQAPALAGPLEKVAKVAGQPTAARAQALLKQAQTAAAGPKAKANVRAKAKAKAKGGKKK